MRRNKTLKRAIVIFISTFLLGTTNAWACEVCEKNQPTVLKGITHGAGPQGSLDYIIIWTAVVIVTVTLLLSLKFLIRPNENDPLHIKNIVLDVK